MKLGRQIAVVFLAMVFFPVAFAASIDGKWMTIDDKTGKKRSVVRLSDDNGTLSGTIIKVFKRSGDTGKCSKCPGHFKDKPVTGLTFLWGLKKKDGDTWIGGKILDPKSGKIYNAKVTMKGNKLYVRGYIGLSMLGRTQVWVRQ